MGKKGKPFNIILLFDEIFLTGMYPSELQKNKLFNDAFVFKPLYVSNDNIFILKSLKLNFLIFGINELHHVK